MSDPSLVELVRFHAAGTVLLGAVAHGLRPRRHWSIPAGVALVLSATAIEVQTLAWSDWEGPVAGVALGVLLWILGGGALELLARWRRPRALHRRTPSPDAPVARLWRGELHPGLALASLLAWLAAAVWVGQVAILAPLISNPRLGPGLVVGIWAVWPIGAAAALLGLWRSTSKEALRRQARPLAWTLRLALVGAWLLLLLVIRAIGLDVVRENAPLAFGPSEHGLFTLRLLRDGKELEVSGEMGFGLTQEVSATLAAHPEVRLLHLDSPGGRVAEGERLAQLVRQRRLGTHVANRCSSACVQVLAAGHPRLLGHGAEIGLHQASRSWSENAYVVRLREARSVDRLVALGVERGFAERGSATPHESVWRPSHEEIFRAHLADRYARPDEVALSGLSPEELERLPLRLRESRLFQALFEFERPFFDAWTESARDGYRRGVSLQEALAPRQQELAELIQRILKQDLPRAADRPLRRFAEAVVETLTEARRGGPDRCAAALSGRLRSRLTGSTLAGADVVSDAIADVLASSRIEPGAPARLDPTSPALVEAYRRAEAEHPGFLDEAEERQEGGAGTAGGACLMVDGTIAVYRALLALPTATGTPLLRALVSEGDDEEGDGEEE